MYWKLIIFSDLILFQVQVCERNHQPGDEVTVSCSFFLFLFTLKKDVYFISYAAISGGYKFNMVHENDLLISGGCNISSSLARRFYNVH